MEAGFGMAFSGAYASHFHTLPNKESLPTSVTSTKYGGPPTSKQFL